MRIPSGVTDQYIYFVAVDSVDFTTRETGLSSFTVVRSRNGGASATMTTPTINETDNSNMPGVYELLLDEDMTIDSGDDSQEMCFHITHAGMAPVTKVIEIYRPKITTGETLTVGGGIASADVVEWLGTAPATPTVAGVPEVDLTHVNGSAASGSSTVDANIVQISGDTTAADTLELFVEALDQSTGQLDSGSLAAGTITASSIATDAIGSDEIASTAVTKIQTGLATPTNITAGTITTTTNLTNLPSIPANWLTAAGIAASALDGKGNWNIGKTGYSLTATTGLGNQTSNITGNLSGSVGSVTGGINTGSGTITTLDALDTAQDTQHGTTQSRLPASLSANGLMQSDVLRVNTQTQTAGDIYQVLSAMYTNVGTAAQVRAAVGLASANLDTQLGDLPTNAELATSQASADDATLAAIAALTIPSETEIADAILLRNVSNVEASAGEHTLCTVVLAMLEHSISGTTLTIKRTDGSTTHVTKTLTVDDTAEPITGIS